LRTVNELTQTERCTTWCNKQTTTCPEC